MATTPTKSRESELRSLGRRSVTAVDAAAPVIDSGFDVTAWDQVLVAVSGDVVGVAEVLVYAQYAGFITTAQAPTMVPMTYLRAVPLKDHTSTYRGNAAFVLNTMKADAIFPSIITFSGAATVYVNVFGITPKGAELISGAGIQGEDDADVFDTVDLIKVGGQTLAAHGLASTTIPVPVGARATVADPTDVDANAVVLLSTTLGSRLRVQAGGVAAHGDAVAGNPVLTGMKATDAEPADVTEGDVEDLSGTLGGRLRVNAVGNVADDAAAALAPVRVAGTADAVLSTVHDGDVAQLVTDLYRRLVTLPHGATADDAADTAALNPVKVGGIAISHLTPDAADAGDVVHLSTDLYRRVRVLPEGPIADDAVADATNPLKVGAVVDVAVADAADGDMVHLVTDLQRRLRVAAEGAGAHDAAVAGFPVIVGAKATAAEPATVTEGDASYLSTNLVGRLRVNAVGNVADDAVADALGPVKVGAVADQVLSTVADADMVHLITDLSRRLQIRDGLAGDDVSGANRVAANTTADERDESAQPWANETLAAATAVYYPSSSGAEIGNRPWLTFQVGIRHGTLTFESSNDGTSWTDVTKTVIDRGQGGGGYASWVEPDAATVYYQLELVAGARYVRALWTPTDATSIIIIYVMARAA
ncbi:MAG: hypothetical protein M0R22_00265 [Dehalococcoidia bacterium]|jgi:hypothetical protein|nr:hypothetical protein [Dehalococcoidia bacterium]